MWTIIVWIVVGLLGGAIAKAIMPGAQGGGWLATMVLGIVGSFVGGLVGSLLFEGKLDFGRPDLSLGGIVTSVIGALIVLFIYGMVTKKKA